MKAFKEKSSEIIYANWGKNKEKTLDNKRRKNNLWLENEPMICIP